MDTKKTYTVNKVNFVLAKLTLNRYKQIFQLLKEVGLNWFSIDKSNESAELTMKFVVLIMSLFDGNKLDEFFKVILCKVDSSDILDVDFDFGEIDEETALEVLSDFFTLKAALIRSKMSILSSSMKESNPNL